MHTDGVRRADLLVLKALLLIGSIAGDAQPLTVSTVRRAKKGFAVGLTALLKADEVLYVNQYCPVILASFAKRGIYPLQRSAAA